MSERCNECGELATYEVPDDGESPVTFWCSKHATNKIDTRLIVHWTNPYTVVNVPIEELVKVAHGIGERWRDQRTDSTFIMTEEEMLKHWRSYGEKLDAYILPQPSGWHDIGVRYGDKDHQYLSPMGNKEKVTALLKKYQKG